MTSLRRGPAALLAFLFGILCAPAAVLGSSCGFPTGTIVPTPTEGGIREEIPAKYRGRYERWKAELVSTDYGRGQWDAYASNRSFVLTVKVAGGKGKGAGTDRFQWNDRGDLVGATITLGNRIDEGYPDPIYYPVLNALSAGGRAFAVSGRILAATKFSHEIGHVGLTAGAKKDLIEKQSRLIPEYTSIFLLNGHNTKDRKLVELAEKMGGTPMEIWEDREYWSEVAALNFLRERIHGEAYRCHVFTKLRHNVETYARGYMDRFDAGSDWGCSN